MLSEHIVAVNTVSCLFPAVKVLLLYRGVIVTAWWCICRGIEKQGLQGLPFGIVKGTLGVFGHPLGSLLGTAASLSGSIRTSLLGVAVLPPRLRPPRHVSRREPLSIYSYIDVSAPHDRVHILCSFPSRHRISVMEVIYKN